MLPAPFPIGVYGILCGHSGIGDRGGEVVVPDQNPAWGGGNDPHGRPAAIDDLEGLAFPDLKLNF